MSSKSDTEIPPEAVAVAKRYVQLERPISALVAGSVVMVFLGSYLLLSLLPAIGVGLCLLVLARGPILRPHGTARLQTEDSIDSVAASFAGSVPPVLGFQWGIADDIRTTGSGVVYEISYLFGLRSLAMRVDSETVGDHQITLAVTADETPWATYDIQIDTAEDGARTSIDVEYTSDQRFGLARLPQLVIANRYRDEILRVQGYDVVERSWKMGVLGTS
jgi:hypothetical protein